MQNAPLITLTSDFGLVDHYVAAMKGVLLKLCHTCRLVDVTHQVPRHDIIAGSFAVERAVSAFGRGTVHLAVVDPGVGSSRRLLMAKIAGQWIVCPDNGLITWAARRQGGWHAWEITWRPREASSTFHGRDILAPVAAMLAMGKAARSLGKPLDDPVWLPISPAEPGAMEGRVIYIDYFGNATTNIPDDGRAGFSVIVGGREVGKLRKTYSDVAKGQALALIGSSGLLEIAVREGSAAKKLGLKVGTKVRINA